MKWKYSIVQGRSTMFNIFFIDSIKETHLICQVCWKRWINNCTLFDFMNSNVKFVTQQYFWQEYKKLTIFKTSSSLVIHMGLECWSFQVSCFFQWSYKPRILVIWFDLNVNWYFKRLVTFWDVSVFAPKRTWIRLDGWDKYEVSISMMC